MTQQRDIRIDLLRGLAIFTMIAANMAAHSLEEPHSVIMRFYGSLAAPLFIFLSGMMVSFTSARKNHPISYYLKRGGLVVLVGVLMDVFIWGTFPVSTFDVLYVIGLSMPILYFTQRLSSLAQVLIILVIVGLTPVLQWIYGYAAYPVELGISPLPAVHEIGEVPIARQWLIDGWFPIFPWLAVSLFGGWIGTRMQALSAEKFDRNIFLIGSTLFTLGALVWWYFSPELYSNEGFVEAARPSNFYHILLTREGYSELFYPPTLYYLAVFIGAILLLLALSRRCQHWKLFHFLTIYGRSSLLVYILHTVFIAFIFNALDTYSIVPFIGLYLIHAAILWGICYATQRFTQGKKLPFLVRFFIGN